MTRKLLASTVIPFLLATAAVAQTDGATSFMGQNWNEETTSVFFADDGAMTLRSEAEIQANWGALSEEDRAAVRNDCAAMDTAAATGATTGTGSTETGTGQNNASTFGTATTGTGAAVAPSSDVTTGTSADTGVADEASTFGDAVTGQNDDAGATIGTVETGTAPAVDGTGQTDASTFGTAATGTGIAQVTSDTWTEVCTLVNDL